ncbi:hypothetical protein MIR68_007232 [Amoeboaphelidium protococcarum]|nr:hypothetical protein MIR68_007232 [Amoeboaphelidium protococcarum]
MFPECPLPFDQTNYMNNNNSSGSTNLKAAHYSDPMTRTQQPIVTGSSVLAVKYKDGIVMAADSLASYGSLARFRDEVRIVEVNNCLVGASGDFGDFQYVKDQLDSLAIAESIRNDADTLTADNVYQYLSQMMYQRRTKMNPLWNSFIVGGVDVKKDGSGDKELVLGCVNLHGTTWQSDCLATGFGAYLAQPLLRKLYEKYPGTNQDSSAQSQQQFQGYKAITLEQAIEVLESCMRVLWCRDARSSKRYYRGVCKYVNGQVQTSVEGPFEVEAEWGFAEDVKGYGRS